VEEFGATGVEGMLEALEVVNQKTDKQSMGAKVCDRDRTIAFGRLVVWSSDGHVWGHHGLDLRLGGQVNACWMLTIRLGN
jgi:hypothetical protein